MPDFEFSETFGKKMGAFVTLNTYPGKMLRGCIGIPEPVISLEYAVEYPEHIKVEGETDFLGNICSR